MIMLSETGIEFLTTFGASRDQIVIKEMRKLYVSYKQRDNLLFAKKSILYSLIMKSIMTLYLDMSDVKVMRISDSTISELTKEMLQQEEGGLEKFKHTTFEKVETYARVRNVQHFLKNFLNSIMLNVLHNRGPQGVLPISRQQDELAYARFVEDLCRFCFQSPANYPLLLSVKTSMHKIFLAQPRLIEYVVQGIKNCAERVKQTSSKDADTNIEFMTFSVERISLKGTPPIEKSTGKKQKRSEEQRIEPIAEDLIDDNDEVPIKAVAPGKPTKHVEGLDAPIGQKRKAVSKAEAPLTK
jgi:hypothetical protein